MTRPPRRRRPGAAAILWGLLVLLALPAGPVAADEGPDPEAAGALRIPFPQDDGTLTPYTFELGYPLMTLVYDTLAWRDADGRPQPWLAESIEVAGDGRQVTVRLREGARWHDGEPVTAADVAFTFSYMAEHFHPRFTPQLAGVGEVAPVDARTAVIDLTRPSPGFADQPLSDVPILPAHLWRDLPEGQAAPESLPVGSGPYRLVEHRPGEAYRFEANPGHVLGAPAVPAIAVPIIRTASDTLAALERRDVDMVPLALPADAQQRVDSLGVTIREGPAYAGTTLLLNLREPPFDDPGARRAVAQALDLTRIARAVGDATPADRGVLHPASEWAHDDPLHAHDPQAAADGFAELRLPHLEVLAPDNDPVKLEAARQVALALSGAGAPAEVVELGRDELSARIGEDGSAVDFQLALWTSPALASYDPDFLAAVFGSDPQAPLNHSGYESADFDALAAQVATTTDPDARRTAASEQLELLARDLPLVPLLFADGAFAYRPAIYDGWVYIAGRGILDKRSFLPAEGAPVAGDDGASETPAPDDSPADPAPEGTPVSPFAWVVGTLVAAAVAFAAVAVVRTRR